MADVAGSVGGVVSPVLQVAEWLAAPIWRQFKYLFNYKINFDSLQEQVDKLKNTRDEVQRKVTAAERNVEEIKQNVKDWQKDVDKAITEAEQLIQKKANNPRCFKGLCPNFINHYKQSKKAFKLKRDDIDPLLQQKKELDPVSFPTNPPEIWLRSSEDYLTFESRNSTVKNVWDALNDEHVYMIGVYGMGGLGKTTLVQELGRKAEKGKLFEEIVFVEVSESPNIKNIQTTIADNLGLEFERESEMAKKLYARMKDKNILLILDNIWEPLEFDKTIGIPCGADRGRNKLLLTTRNLDVLEKMGSINNFGMGILEEEEAWTLFTKMAGNIIQTRELHSLPNDVCKECGGLPIVICTIAKTLKNKSHPSDWKVALQELRAPSPTKFTGFLEKEYLKIALSYKYLRDNELQKIFLISSILENNSSISDLFRHVVCLDILEGANLTMEDTRDRLDKLVHDLKDACLLLNGFESGQFAMHDVVRAVAITIAYVDHHVFTERNDVERDWKDKDKFKKCTKISLPSNSIITSQIWPNNLDCPNLEYFSMWNSFYFNISEHFFIAMSKLKVLNLVGLQQSSLPSSIDLLTNLQTLCLNNSKVKDFAIIGKLMTLKVLSLQFSVIRKFPIEFSQLTQLRLLDLSNSRELHIIAPNVISQLSQLEEFYVKGCPIWWRHDVLRELILLSNLTGLELDIRDTSVLPKDFLSKELKRYKISIVNFSFEYRLSMERRFQYLTVHMEHEILRILEFESNSTISLKELWGFKNVEFLCLVKFSDDESDIEDSKFNLQTNETRPLFDKKVIFTNLMGLELVEISFGKIWEGQLSTSSYQNLTQLIVESCDKIKHVFPFSIAKSLQQLQNLEIRCCNVLEKIVEEEEEEEGAEVIYSIFPQLTQLKLRSLSKLRVFYQGVHALELSMLKRLEIIYCPNFTMRYQGFQDNNEGEVKVSESKSSSLGNKTIGDIQAAQDALAEVTTRPRSYLYRDFFQKDAPPSISAADPVGSASGMEVASPNNVTPVHEGQAGSDPPAATNQNSHTVATTQPSEVIFTNLMALKFVKIKFGKIWECQLSTYSYQNLTRLMLERCDNMKHVFPFSVAKSLQQLRYLDIQKCEVLEKIVEEEEGAKNINSIFPRITRLKLENLPKLTIFYQRLYALELPMLKMLKIKYCPNFTSRCQGFLDNNEGVQVSESKSIYLELEHKINSDLDVFELIDGWEKKMIIWESQSRTLDISYTYIPVGFLERFYNMKKLQLSKIQNKEIEILSDPRDLEVLHVSSCYKLMSLLSFSASFQNLFVLKISSCYGFIMKLLTSSMAKSMVQLREMSIESCGMLTEIVENEGHAITTKIVFNNLNKLSLEDLQCLTSFCFGNYSFNFPSLEELIIEGCPHMKTFSSGSLNIPKLHNVHYEKKLVEIGENDLNTIIQKAHKKRVNSNLKKLTLSERNIVSIWQGEFKENFEKVETLELIKDEYAYIPIHILMKFINIEELILKVSSYEVIFSCGEDEERIGALAKLKVLKFEGHFNLKCIWKQDFRFKSILQNLCSLYVKYCHNMMTLLPPSSLFENLWSLEITHCNGMQNLMTSSTAKSLVRLKYLTIQDCEMMIEVLVNEGDAEKDEIVFEKLSDLSLFDLKSLTCFCSESYTLKFPQLFMLNVCGCSKMKTFSGKSLNMPGLMLLNEIECFSDLDLVTQQLQNDCSKLWERFPLMRR